jgi:hypothetical protein
MDTSDLDEFISFLKTLKEGGNDNGEKIDEYIEKKLREQWGELRLMDIKRTQAYRNLPSSWNKTTKSKKDLIPLLIRNSKFPPPDPSVFKKIGFN